MGRGQSARRTSQGASMFGRWRDVLSAEECARWLAGGDLAG
jgi:hypothetical protein